MVQFWSRLTATNGGANSRFDNHAVQCMPFARELDPNTVTLPQRDAINQPTRIIDGLANVKNAHRPGLPVDMQIQVLESISSRLEALHDFITCVAGGGGWGSCLGGGCSGCGGWGSCRDGGEVPRDVTATDHVRVLLVEGSEVARAAGLGLRLLFLRRRSRGSRGLWDRGSGIHRVGRCRRCVEPESHLVVDLPCTREAKQRQG